MYRLQPYARPYDSQHSSNMSYLRADPIRSPSAEPRPANPFQLRSRAVFQDCDYYDSENTSESSRSPSRSSSSRSTPVDEYYAYSAPNTPEQHYSNTPFSYDPRRSHGTGQYHQLRQYETHDYYQDRHHQHEPPAHLQLPPLAPPQAQMEYYPGPTLPPLQLPVTVDVQPADSVDPAIIEAYIQRPFVELGVKTKKKAICTWPKVSAYGHEPGACAYTARSDMVVRHIRAVHFKIK